mmetsp:Transcript_4161/g.6354  ORF Transcript_4161/g.6354 Transcript_4161/m.6354 type:complete len:95 (+) Transcript_4161:147-431(+)
MAWDSEGRQTEKAGDHGQRYGAAVCIVIVIDVERSGSRGQVLAEMDELASNGADWAGEGLAIGGVGVLFTFDPILLGGEGNGNEGGGAELSEGG